MLELQWELLWELLFESQFEAQLVAIADVKPGVEDHRPHRIQNRVTADWRRGLGRQWINPRVAAARRLNSRDCGDGLHRVPGGSTGHQPKAVEQKRNYVNDIADAKACSLPCPSQPTNGAPNAVNQTNSPNATACMSNVRLMFMRSPYGTGWR